jgi:D-alanyl-D-alanine carboxypeptidase
VASGIAGFPDIAVDTLIADPASYAAAAGVPDLATLMHTGVVLATQEAQLRKVGVGGKITYTDGTSLPVTAVVDAHEIGGHEMATGLGARPLVSGATADYLLVAGEPSVPVLTTIAHATWPTRTIRVKDHTANGYMSGVDTVLTQLQTKLDFGEFASRPAGPGTFVPDPTWIKDHLSSRRIVQLGDVTCNTAIIHDLTAAMQEVTSRGLDSLIDTADFQYEGGCWNPRAARAIAGGTLSIHSWGAAVDINVKNNPLGATPHQDPRLVAIMAAHGFAWGGRFLRPDGGHFQWVGNTIPH